MPLIFIIRKIAATAHNYQTQEHCAAAPYTCAAICTGLLSLQASHTSLVAGLRRWRALVAQPSPTRQDRFAALAPLAAVLMFMAAIVAAFWYLRMEEGEREQEALRRDAEYAQQRVRLRLLERQEQLMRIARDLSNHDMDKAQFGQRAEALISRYPELQAITWLDERGRDPKPAMRAPSLAGEQVRVPGEVLKSGETADTFGLARDLQQPVYAQQSASRR